MKVTLNEAQAIKGKDYEAGEEVIVSKELGERLIEEGIANRLIAKVENRVVGLGDDDTHIVIGREASGRFINHKKFGRQ